MVRPMNQNQVIGIGVGVVTLVVLAIAGSMWAMSPSEEVPVAATRTAALDEAQLTPAARAAGAGGGAAAMRARGAGGARAAKLQAMDPEQRAALKAKLQARRAQRGAGAGAAGAGAGAGARRRRGGGGGGAAKMDAVNARLDSYAKDAGWDTDTTEEVRSIIEETHTHVAETMKSARAGGDKAGARDELSSYRQEQSDMLKEVVGEDQFDDFVNTMGMQRFFGAGPAAGAPAAGAANP